MGIRVLAPCILAAASGATLGQQSKLSCVRVATGLTNPLYVTAPRGDTSRVFIVEQHGSGGVASRADIRIMNLSNNSINATPFLTLNGLASGDEQGLLGLAFDPNYATTGYFFVFYTDGGGVLHIDRYQVSANPNVANAGSGVGVLTHTHPFDNHNGGWMGFGPDGFLYAGIGDGGASGDPNGNGQSLTTLLGKLIRIDVRTLPYTIPATNPFAGSLTNREEIWAYGLRNPWRNSFDRGSGALWIADVGQNQIEEINFQPLGPGGPGTARNYGWRCYEGNNTFNTSGCAAQSTMTFPVHTFDHSAGRCSITGGYVYRGAAIPSLRGTYFFGDFCGGQVYSFRYGAGGVYAFHDRTAELTAQGQAVQLITSFGEDAAGEVYIVCQPGDIFRITNGCWGNCDGSTTAPILNVLDFQCFVNRFASGDSYANCDESTTAPLLNILDYQCFINAFAAGCT